jgi:L-iditol 2-dehydrogenase
VRAARFHGPGDVRVEELARPEPRAGDVLVQVEVALTDGTDLKAFRRGHPLLLSDPPSPFGHEFCGVDVATGRRVVAANSDADGTPGAELALLNGAYAEYLLVPERIAGVNLLPVPDGLASEVAAMVEPLACCLRGVERTGVEAGQSVAILGTGPIGLMLCACVSDAGARPLAVGGRPERRALAPLFGAEVGERGGADVVIEAAGTAEAWRDAAALARPGGTVLYFGGLERGATVEVDAYRLHYEELTLRGSFHHTPRHVRAALAFLASGAYPWERLVTHRIGLDELPGLFADPPRDLLKAAVYP